MNDSQEDIYTMIALTHRAFASKAGEKKLGTTIDIQKKLAHCVFKEDVMKVLLEFNSNAQECNV